MSNRTSRERAASRAEARRRSRLSARGEPVDTTENEEVAGEAAAEGRGGFLTRIFPPAPPLPGRPDPLRGFDPDGPLRPVRERLFLLRRNPLAWIPTGFVAFLAFYASFFYQGNFLGLVATFAQFGALIAAGWFGWQRPTLYGTAAGALSGVATAVIVLVDFVRIGVPPETFGTPAEVALNFVITVLYQTAFGFLGGWYGGYLRRRQNQLSTEARRRR
jgi:hypothetical protein